MTCEKRCRLIFLLLSSAWGRSIKLTIFAMRARKDYGVTSPRLWTNGMHLQHIPTYLMTWKIMIFFNCVMKFPCQVVSLPPTWYSLQSAHWQVLVLLDFFLLRAELTSFCIRIILWTCPPITGGLWIAKLSTNLFEAVTSSFRRPTTSIKAGLKEGYVPHVYPALPFQLAFITNCWFPNHFFQPWMALFTV